MVNLNLVKINTLLILIYNDFLSKGNIPWYMDYDDISQLFETSSLHAGASLNADMAMFELLVSIIARQKKDKRFHYRHDNATYRPAWVGLSSVAFQATNTFAKLSGGYFNEGLTSALVTPSTTNESIETLIRQ
jgi:hypothetical protein